MLYTSFVRSSVSTTYVQSILPVTLCVSTLARLESSGVACILLRKASCQHVKKWTKVRSCCILFTTLKILDKDDMDVRNLKNILHDTQLLIFLLHWGHIKAEWKCCQVNAKFWNLSTKHNMRRLVGCYHVMFVYSKNAAYREVSMDPDLFWCSTWFETVFYSDPVDSLSVLLL
jgi:hypothetical protein